jgi:uncharacterized protein (DUF1015 family)
LRNLHLMWLTNVESGDLGILPTHRIVHGLTDFNKNTFLEKLSRYFDIDVVNQGENKNQAPCENLWTFMLIFSEEHYLIRLKESVFSQFDADLPDVVKRLDLSVLHYFVFEKCLDLRGQSQFEHLDFSQYRSHCYKSVAEGKADFAVLTRRITVEEIQAVCESGYKMPAKATYFFPKVLGGLVFSSIQE